jgi:single-stranded-DNA-specific exonuclease
LSRYRWNLLPPAPDGFLGSESGFSPLLAQLLYNRGVTNLSQVAPFLSADISLTHDPALLPGIPEAVSRIYRALLSGESIAVYGDFDADGITGTALLVRGLSSLGGRVIPYIPHRLTEGYGLRAAALEKLRQDGVSLVISVDCGITALDEVKKAKRLKLDIIITDHHTPLPELPAALAVINPKRADSSYPFTELTGAGVALKLLQALYTGVGKPERLEEMMDLAAIGTIADVAPLTGENRYLVKEGLRRINLNPRPGIKEIIAQAGLTDGKLDAQSISWVIAPRLNAAGRVADAINSYQLLMTESPEEARMLAAWLEGKNTERQQLSAKTLSRAREQVRAHGIEPIIIASDSEYPMGIAGLVAGKLAEEFYRPAIVIRTGEQTSSGSCRSIPEFNIIAALSQCSSLMSHFGGHSQAAGFTLPTAKLESLKQRLLAMATEQLAGVVPGLFLDIDACATFPDLNGKTYESMQRLAPFGRGNPDPIFLTRKAEVISCRTMGANQEHLRLRLRDGGMLWDAVAFRLGEYRGEIAARLDIVYNLEIDHWNGAERLRLNILDFAPA